MNGQNNTGLRNNRRSLSQLLNTSQMLYLEAPYLGRHLDQMLLAVKRKWHFVTVNVRQDVKCMKYLVYSDENMAQIVVVLVCIDNPYNSSTIRISMCYLNRKISFLPGSALGEA